MLLYNKSIKQNDDIKIEKIHELLQQPESPQHELRDGVYHKIQGCFLFYIASVMEHIILHK